MKAWTVPQPYASLIVMGAMRHFISSQKPYYPVIQEKVVVFADAKHPEPDELERLHRKIYDPQGNRTVIDLDKGGRLISALLDGARRGTRISHVPCGCGIGTIIIGQAIPITDLFPDQGDVQRQRWAWPLTEPEEFSRSQHAVPPPAQFWTWPMGGDDA